MTISVLVNQAWQGKTDCLHCSLRSSALFSGLTEDDFMSFHQPVDQISLKSGEVLYEMNQAGHHLFTVRSGLLKLVQYLPDGTQRIVRLVRSTDVLGLEVMVGQHYDHQVVALQESELCRYPVEAVNQLSQRNSALHKDLMARWQKALTEADSWLTQFSTGAAKKRMANFLLSMVEGQEKAECTLLSREDMGSILSITTETASRMISDFKRSGIIKDIKQNHVCLDVDALSKLVKN